MSWPAGEVMSHEYSRLHRLMLTMENGGTFPRRGKTFTTKPPTTSNIFKHPESELDVDDVLKFHYRIEDSPKDVRNTNKSRGGYTRITEAGHWNLIALHSK